MKNTLYHYAIIGAGAAGIHLALAMRNDAYFNDKQILIVEKSTKSSNDRTWCFWESGTGPWDELLHHSWGAGHFHSSKGSQPLQMEDYRYKMLRAIDFYEHAKKEIAKAPNFHWVQDSIDAVTVGEYCHLEGRQAYHARHVFDSRIDPAFHSNTDGYTRILQHFKGWIIETEEDIFDPDQFTMMDFRLKWRDSTSFTYVLPISPRRAMVEFTLFTSQLIEDEGYDQMLRKYLKQFFDLDQFKIVETEYGIIPMSDYPFHKHHQNALTKIGTAGGWVRPSTGYSFKNGAKYAQQIIQNIKAGKNPSQNIATNRFRIYDAILLNILKNKNHLGEEIFHSMFKKNSTTQIFKFLGEDSSLLEELKIISSFKWAPFLQGAWRWMVGK